MPQLATIARRNYGARGASGRNGFGALDEKVGQVDNPAGSLFPSADERRNRPVRTRGFDRDLPAPAAARAGTE